MTGAGEGLAQCGRGKQCEIFQRLLGMLPQIEHVGVEIGAPVRQLLGIRRGDRLEAGAQDLRCMRR
jgi:hypothetical protein